jgi:putative ABC transport system permease protein
MQIRDLLGLAGSAITHHPLRSLLSALGIAVGVAAVILLTALGEGLHRFVLAEFTQFGTHIVAVTPGKTETHGGSVGMFGSTRPLTLEDSAALAQLPLVESVNPVVQGNVEVEAEVDGRSRARRVTLYGVGPDFAQAFRMQVALGRFLPRDDLTRPRAFVVLGSKVRQELFADQNPLGALLRVGGQRYRVVGVMGAKGQVLGFDLDDTVYLPAARALELFNRDGLMEIDVVHRAEASPSAVAASVSRLLAARHGDEDFTVTPQQQQLDVLDSVLGVLTFAVGALGGVSLLVGGVGILTLMTIAVAERTGEIGLLNALGARQGQIMALFLAEAAGLALLGGLAGLGMGLGLAQMLALLVPALPVQVSWAYVLAAEGVAVGIGLLAGVAPARRAARMDPVVALRAE